MAESEFIEFQGYQVRVRRHPRRKRLSISVHSDGEVRVSANKTLSQRQILKFLLKQSSWIDEAVSHNRQLREKYPEPKLVTGDVFSYLGNDYSLRLLYGPSLSLRFSDGYLDYTISEPEQNLSPERREHYFGLLKRNYRRVAERVMTQRIELQSQRMSLEPLSVHFRGQKTIWGSCTAANKINLNFKLIVAPLYVIDYVIIHELAHIVHKNHSKNFWSLVEAYTDRRHDAKKWLSEHHYKTAFLDKK